jgi:transposase
MNCSAIAGALIWKTSMLDLLELPGVIPVDIRHGIKDETIVVEMTEDKTPLCEGCGKPMYKHGRRKNVFADIAKGMKPVRLEILRPRYRCDACGRLSIPELMFIDERRRATQRLVEYIHENCLGTTFCEMSRRTGLAVNTIKNIALDKIADLEQTVRYETPVIMGIDEVTLAGGYRCVITNLVTNSVFDMLEERTQKHLKPYFKTLPDREKVEWVCTDMWRPFKESFGSFLPNARLVIDKFHVVKIASSALEDERKKYQAQLSKNDRILVKKSIRWLILKRPSSLSRAEKLALEEVRRSIPELAEAYDLKEAFYRVYDDPDKNSAVHAFEAWEDNLPRRGMEGFRTLAKTVHNHFEDIFAYWDSPSRITNAYTECLNGLIKIANRMGRGYSYEIIRAKTLYSSYARNVGKGLSTTGAAGSPKAVEYGPHIPTLVDTAEAGGLE